MQSPPEFFGDEDKPSRPAHVQNLAEFQDTAQLTSFGRPDLVQTAQQRNRVSFSPSSLQKQRQRSDIACQRVETLGVSRSKEMVGAHPDDASR